MGIRKKGFFQNSILMIDGEEYQIIFFDRHRVLQEMEDELKSSQVFLEKNLVVVNSITRKNMELAVEKIMNDGRYLSLAPD